MSQIKMTEEQSRRLNCQLMRAVKTEASIDCLGSHPLAEPPEKCRTVPLWKSYRCFYCGFYFCPACAPRHFDNVQERENVAAPPKEPEA